jgi:hypothetical protein
MATPNKTHVFITIENLVKIYQHKNAIVKVNKSHHEDHLQAMKEAGVEINGDLSIEVQDFDASEIDTEIVDSKSLKETPKPKLSGAVNIGQ